MRASEPGCIDLGFRPESCFWPLGLETHRVTRIKGAKRRSSNLDLSQHALSKGRSGWVAYDRNLLALSKWSWIGPLL